MVAQDAQKCIVNPFAAFITDLQKGRFSTLYKREKELQNELTKHHYEEQSVRNSEKYYRNKRAVQLKKRNPVNFTKDIEYNMLSDDNFSIVTETDLELQQDIEIVPTPQEKTILAERVINTARRAEANIKNLKQTKNVISARKVDPEWIENYRN